MKTSELTMDIVRSAILPASSMKDQEATMKWLALPENLRGRCRAAERVASLITPNVPLRKEPLPVPVPTPVPPAAEDLPAAPAPAVEPAPESSPVVASVDIKEDGSVTVHPKRPPTIPPPPAVPAIEAPMAVTLTTQEPLPREKIAAGIDKVLEKDLTPEAALRAIRALYKSWKGGQYVCGNAYKTMHGVEELISRAGF